MKRSGYWQFALLGVAWLLAVPPAKAACNSPVAMQILGSGGPIAEGFKRWMSFKPADL